MKIPVPIRAFQITSLLVSFMFLAPSIKLMSVFSNPEILMVEKISKLIIPILLISIFLIPGIAVTTGKRWTYYWAILTTFLLFSIFIIMGIVTYRKNTDPRLFVFLPTFVGPLGWLLWELIFNKNVRGYLKEKKSMYANAK